MVAREQRKWECKETSIQVKKIVRSQKSKDSSHNTVQQEFRPRKRLHSNCRTKIRGMNAVTDFNTTTIKLK